MPRGAGGKSGTPDYAKKFVNEHMDKKPVGRPTKTPPTDHPDMSKKENAIRKEWGINDSA